MEARTVEFTPSGDLIRWIGMPGSGEPVLYVHGLGCHGAATWADSAARLGRSAVIVDRPGHGRSDRPEDFGYSLPELADALAAVIRGLGRGPLDVISHSLGGSAAIVLAARHPQLSRYYCYDRHDGDADPAPHGIGYLTREQLEAWLPEAQDGVRDVDVYFLGPKPFMRMMRRHLQQAGVPDAQVRYEFFGPAAALQ